MTRLPLWQVDAFAGRRFQGNPAAVVPLAAWLPDATLQAIAAENNLAETAFLVAESGTGDRAYKLRWFTPAIEIDLCGHATLAAGYVIDHHLAPGQGPMRFQTRSGELRVTAEGDRYCLDFPSRPPTPVADPGIGPALGVAPLQVLAQGMLLALLPDAAAVRAARPDFRALAALPGDGLIITAKGDGEDFVSRYFAPFAGIDEDPVTGSAHCLLTPFWAARLGKQRLFARQVSARGGELWLELRGERVLIAGQVQPYLEGFIEV